MRPRRLTYECLTCGATAETAQFYPSVKTCCKSCAREKAAPKRLDKLRYLRQWKLDHPEAFKTWYVRNKDRRAEYWAQWYEQHKPQRSQSNAKWLKQNRHRSRAIAAKRNAIKKRQMPVWANLDAIRKIYAEAVRVSRETGVQHHVDHIYPLQSDVVCGLHCEANLRVIRGIDNQRKKNKMPQVAA